MFLYGNKEPVSLRLRFGRQVVGRHLFQVPPHPSPPPFYWVNCLFETFVWQVFGFHCHIIYNPHFPTRRLLFPSFHGSYDDWFILFNLDKGGNRKKQIAVLTLCCDGMSFARVTWRWVGGDSPEEVRQHRAVLSSLPFLRFLWLLYL